MSCNPDSIRWVVALLALYLHVGPFSREVIARIENIMATLEPLVIEPRAPVEGEFESRDVTRSRPAISTLNASYRLNAMSHMVQIDRKA